MAKTSQQIVLFSILLLGFVSQRASGQCTGGGLGCKDCYTWCKDYKHLCDQSIVGKYCSKTCGTATSCGIDACANCEHKCVVDSAANTAKCGCFNGYTLASDGHSCEDINECLIPDICKNVEGQPIKNCLNTNGSYNCHACSGSDMRGFYKQEGCCKITGNFESCGQSSTTGRIVGGENTDIEKWPWQVYVVIRSQVCGGSIINKDWIVTAGHCVVDIGQQDYHLLTVVAGVTETVNQTSVHHQTCDVAEIILHPTYTNLRNDIALIRVSQRFNYGTYVKPICLPNGETPKPGDRCFATGYGTTSYRGALAVQLQEVMLPVVDYATCNKSYNGTKYTVNPNTMICAGYAEGGKDACQGDSGGPYVCQRCKKCDWYLAGITSFGIGCADAGRYGVFTNVENFEKWIEQQIGYTVTKNNAVCDESTWSPWQDWSDCTELCDTGSRTRFRTCSGTRCRGSNAETEPCNTHTCSEGRWEDWAPWSQCSQTCGSASRSRLRSCIGGIVGQPECIGSSSESELCGPEKCPRWGPWSDYSPCTLTCGTEGLKSRSRACEYGTPGQDGCKGVTSETRGCNMKTCPSWSSYSYEKCSVTCGTGTQKGTRTCLNGNVGDIGCEGKTQRTKSCTPATCPNEWTNWSKCSMTCGGGTRTRSRGAESESEACETGECPQWGRWGIWNACSKTCGGGTQRSERACENGNIGDIGCEGKSARTRKCSEESCPVWGPWGVWNDCSKTCGNGTRTSSRACINGTVGQIGCTGSTTKSESCNEQLCPIWSNWSKFGSCNVTCGGGIKVSTRQCENGNVGQDGCIGKTRRTRVCAESICPVFSQWAEYGPCDESCGPGKKTRTRTCPHVGLCPADEHGVVLSQQADCNLGECQWNAWGPYGDCSKTCGTGEKTRTRTCSAGAGKCFGSSENTTSCTLAACPADKCSNEVNVDTQEACTLYTRAGYCVQFAPYMALNCALECCRERNGIVAPQPCLDTVPSVCLIYINLCPTNNAYMNSNCRKTCKFCE